MLQLTVLLCLMVAAFSLQMQPLHRGSSFAKVRHFQQRSTLKMTVEPTIFFNEPSTLLEAVAPAPLQAYVNFWADIFKAWDVPELLIHWGHGAAMATVLVFMGGIGTFLGLQIRNGNGNAEYAFTLGKTAREQHPLIMGLAAFFFLLGGQGGLVLLTVEGKPILESPHAISAAVGLGLLALQVCFLFSNISSNAKLIILKNREPCHCFSRENRINLHVLLILTSACRQW